MTPILVWSCCSVELSAVFGRILRTTHGCGTEPSGLRSVRPPFLLTDTLSEWITMSSTRPCSCLAGTALPLYEATLGSWPWRPEDAPRWKRRPRSRRVVARTKLFDVRRGGCTDPCTCNWALQHGPNASDFAGGRLQHRYPGSLRLVPGSLRFIPVKPDTASRRVDGNWQLANPRPSPPYDGQARDPCKPTTFGPAMGGRNGSPRKRSRQSNPVRPRPAHDRKSSADCWGRGGSGDPVARSKAHDLVAQAPCQAPCLPRCHSWQHRRAALALGELRSPKPAESRLRAKLPAPH